MATETLTDGTTLNASIILEKQTGTKVTFDTDQKYVTKDIELTISAPTASPNFTSASLGDTGASATFTNMTTSTTNSSGVVIATSGSAKRGAISYSGAVNGWLSVSNGANALEAAQQAESWNGTTYYATGVTLTNGTQFNITVPDGNSTATHTISVDSEGNVSGITSASGAAITIWDETDANGGIIRHIEAVDLSSDTVTAGHLEYGYTAHDAQGNAIVGTLITGGDTPTLQAKTNITPTESSQTITADNGYDGLSSVQINAISSTYVGSGITSRSSSDLTASGATVTVPAGYYSTQATKSVSSLTLPTSASASATSGYTSKATISPSTSDQYINIGTGYNSTTSYYKISAMTTMTLPTSAAASATSGYTSKATISRSTSDQYINIPPGYNSAGAYYKINAVQNGSATGPSSLSGTSATVSTGTNTITLTKTGVTTTPTVSAGYVASATASTATVTLTASVTTKAATTYHPSSSDQTIASGTYTTGTQTIKAVTVSGLSASSILSGTTVKIGDSTDDDCVTSVSGSVTFQTYYTGSSTPSPSTGVNGDIYLKTS